MSLYSKIKGSKAYADSGYKIIKQYLEEELGLTMAAKWLKVFELFAHTLGVDEKTMLEIGFDKMGIIFPVANTLQSDPDELNRWLQKAVDYSPKDLKSDVKDWKKREDAKKRTLKDILIEQVTKQMCTMMDVNKKELEFRIKLFFSEKQGSIQEIYDDIKKYVAKFHRENPDIHQIQRATENDQYFMNLTVDTDFAVYNKLLPDWRMVKGNLTTLEIIRYEAEFQDGPRKLQQKSEREFKEILRNTEETAGYLVLSSDGLLTDKSMKKLVDSGYTIIECSSSEPFQIIDYLEDDIIESCFDSHGTMLNVFDQLINSDDKYITKEIELPM